MLLPAVVVMAYQHTFISLQSRFIPMDPFAGSRVASQKLGDWMQDFDPWQVVFWIASGWLAMGLIYPAAGYLIPSRTMPTLAQATPSDNYIAVRNMMISVVLLFAGYLVFESFDAMVFASSRRVFTTLATRTRVPSG